jgi:hypothetical protein
MRPIMSIEVRDRLRSFLILTVQMIRGRLQKASETKRQISPICRSETRAIPSLTGEFLDRWWNEELDGEALRAESTRPRPLRQAGNRSTFARETRNSRHPSVTVAIKMHACYHIMKFISYKSHLSLDAEYLILANAATPFRLPSQGDVKPLSAVIYFLWPDWSLFEPVVQRPASDAMRQ